VDHSFFKLYGGTVETREKSSPLDVVLPDPLPEWNDQSDDQLVLVLKSNRLGDPSLPDDLGERLLISFIRAIADGADVPASILLYGQACTLLQSDHAVFQDMKRMQDQGSEILCCRMSYSELVGKGKPDIGHLADWLDLTDRMKRAQKVLWP
jgi:hypothetical protein